MIIQDEAICPGCGLPVPLSGYMDNKHRYWHGTCAMEVLGKKIAKKPKKAKRE